MSPPKFQPGEYVYVVHESEMQIARASVERVWFDDAGLWRYMMHGNAAWWPECLVHDHITDAVARLMEHKSMMDSMAATRADA
jgi:hypothetical protein